MTKLEALDPDLTPTVDDLLYVVDTPEGIPTANKVTIENLLAIYDDRVATMTNKTITGYTGDSATDLSAKSWFLDEDDLVSDDATKVPSQQSVKAYVDALPSANITASNVGTVGTGIFKQKTVDDLEFYKLNSGNDQLTIALDGTDKMDLTIVEGNIDHDALENYLASEHFTQASITTVGTVTTGVWNGTDINVADGGTGLSATTAYAVLCGGTTTTGALQSIASVGTVGQIMTSNGAGALPTMQDASGGGMTPAYVSETRTISLTTTNHFRLGTVVSNVTESGITYTNVDGRFTVNSDGVYSINAVSYLNGGRATNLYIKKNGSIILTAQTYVHTSVDPVERTLTAVVSMVDTDYITIENNGGTTVILGSTCSIWKISD